MPHQGPGGDQQADLAIPATLPKPRPVSGRFLISELLLIFGRRRNWAGMAVLAAVTIILAVANYFSPETQSAGGADFFTAITSNGLFVALACLAVALRTASPLFLALAYTTAFLNTLNLVPVLGLDGAQATYALNRLQRILIVATCVFLYVILREWVYLAVAAGMAWRAFTGNAPEQPSTRGFVAFSLLLVALGAIMWAAPDTSRSAYGMYPH